MLLFLFFFIIIIIKAFEKANSNIHLESYSEQSEKKMSTIVHGYQTHKH